MSRITDYNNPYELARSTLMMQQKLNNRSKEAMTQRQITPEVKPTKQEVKLLGLDDDQPEIIADKNRKAVSIQIQLENISNNAIIDELGWKPSKIKSEVTQKMIDQYKAEMNQPVKVFDPNVGRDGKYVVYKYKPSSVDLTPVQPEDLEPALTDDDIKNLSARIIQLNLEYKKLDKATREFPKIQKQIEDDYNKEKARELAMTHAGPDETLFSNIETAIMNGIKRKEVQNNFASQLFMTLIPSDTINKRNDAILAEIERQRAAAITFTADKNFHDARVKLEDEITATDDRQKEIKMLIDEIKIKIADNKRVIHDNNIKIAEADKLTKAKVNEAVKELELLNSGNSIPTQQAGESDEDYRLRLQEIGNEVLDDAEIEREAGLLQNVKAKYNLKELLSDEGQIETIIKKLTQDELTEMNTLFTGIKKKYLEVYGFNNDNMNVNKIVEFIKQMIPSMNASLLAPAGPDPIAETKAPTTAAGTRPHTPFEAIQEYAATQGVKPGTKSLNRLVSEIELKLGPVPENLLQKLRDADLQKLAADGLIRYYEPMKDYQPGGAFNRGAAAAVGPTLTGVGMGVHLKKLPKVIKLGHIHINPSNLYYENILSVRNPKNKPLRAYKDEHLSDYLASLLIKLVEGGHITKHELQPLSDHEKMIYDNLIKRSKLHKMHDNSFDQTALKMKQRLEVLEGELEAGNTNDKIKSEIHGLLFKLAHAKVISQVDANKHWKSIMEIY